jgi:alpha-tubulin suppressor-like RCC1 family protein
MVHLTVKSTTSSLFKASSIFMSKFFLSLLIPFLLIGCGDENKIAVAAGDGYSLALDKDGNVYGTGLNDGQLGLSKINSNCGLFTVTVLPFEDTYYCKVFTKVSSLKNIVAIAAGSSHSFALDSNGKVYATGYNSYGQLGFGDSGSGTDRSTFTEVSSLKGKNIVAIAAGDSHSLALDSSGKVYTAGYNYYGQLGLDDTNSRSSFTEVSSLKNIVAIAAGKYHSFAIDSNGKVYATGYNSYGQLGLSNTNSRSSFVEVSSLKNIVAIAAGDSHSFALDRDGKVYATGYNYYGQLGLSDNNDRSTFTEVTLLSGKQVTTIVAGPSHSFVIDDDGKAYATGYNSYGELGLDDRNNHNTFTEVTLLSSKRVTAIAAGKYHSLAIDGNDKIYATGYNIYCELGFSDFKDRYGFTEITR